MNELIGSRISISISRSWADWEEEEAEPTMCLFDNDVFPSPEETLQHMKTAHGFDLSRIRKEHGNISNNRNMWYTIGLTTCASLCRSGILQNGGASQLHQTSVVT